MRVASIVIFALSSISAAAANPVYRMTDLGCGPGSSGGNATDWIVSRYTVYMGGTGEEGGPGSIYGWYWINAWPPLTLTHGLPGSGEFQRWGFFFEGFGGSDYEARDGSGHDPQPPLGHRGAGDSGRGQNHVAPIPEPSTLVLLTIGMLFCALLRAWGGRSTH